MQCFSVSYCLVCPALLISSWKCPQDCYVSRVCWMMVCSIILFGCTRNQDQSSPAFQFLPVAKKTYCITTILITTNYIPLLAGDWSEMLLEVCSNHNSFQFFCKTRISIAFPGEDLLFHLWSIGQASGERVHPSLLQNPIELFCAKAKQANSHVK